MAKFPTYEEMGKKVAEKALDEFLYDGKSIREWMQIIASEDAISKQAVFEQIGGWIASGEYEFTNATDYLSKRIKAIPPVSGSEKPKSENKVLKNIRLDIALKYITEDSDEYGDEAKWINMGLRTALEVIDKYMAERSEEE